MKALVCLIGMFVGFVANAQSTNGITINNSRVTINNYYITRPAVVQTNVVQQPKKMVALPPEVVERLKWEAMLDERRITLFRRQIGK